MRRSVTRYSLVVFLGLLGIALLLGCGQRSGTVGDASTCVLVVRRGESIQAAIDEAPEGAVICLAQGTWSESIVLDRSLTIRGQGPERTVILPGRFGQPVAWIAGGDVVLEGIAFANGSGSGATAQPPSAALAVTGAAAVRAIGCRFTASFPAGIHVGDTATVSIEGCRLSDNTQYGLMATASSRVDLQDSLVVGNRDFGIWVSGDATVSAQGTRIERSGSGGIWVRDQGQLSLLHSTVDGSESTGVLAQQSARVSIRESTLSNNWGPGVRLFDRAALQIVDALVRLNMHGIDLMGTSSAGVSQCRFEQNRWDGIRAGGLGSVTIQDSRLERNQRGIAVVGPMQVALTDNIVQHNIGAGLYAFGGAIEGERNSIANNGIDLLGTISGEIRLSLSEPTAAELVWPHEGFSSLQMAIDALIPGGTLHLQPGEHVAGVVVDKPLQIVGQDGATLLARNGDWPVISLVNGADLEIHGVRILGGSEGVAACGNAQLSVFGCSIEGHVTGLAFWFSSHGTIHRSLIADNAETGVWVWDEAEVTLQDSVLARNADGAVAVGRAGTLFMNHCLVERNGSMNPGQRTWGGILLMDHAHVQIVGNDFFANAPYGVTLYGSPCIGRGQQFFGELTGRDNVFRETRRRDTCPADVLQDLVSEVRAAL